MTGHELSKLKGMNATLRVPDRALGSVNVPVTILDTRTSYGRDELFVEVRRSRDQAACFAGAWVSADRVKVRKP